VVFLRVHCNISVNENTLIPGKNTPSIKLFSLSETDWKCLHDPCGYFSDYEMDFSPFDVVSQCCFWSITNKCCCFLLLFERFGLLLVLWHCVL